MEAKFKTGDIVYERVRPSQQLIIKRYVDLLYYCATPERSHGKTLVFFERELTASTHLVIRST